MPRFTVFRGRRDDRLLLDCQADRLSHLKTRFVVPLVPAHIVPDRIGAMHPEFVIDGETLVLATHLASAVLLSELGSVVASLADRDYDIIRALDVLIGAS